MNTPGRAARERHTPLECGEPFHVRQRSDLAVKIEESLEALDGVVKYHADRLSRFGDELDRQAAEYEALDDGVTGQLKEAGPR